MSTCFPAPLRRHARTGAAAGLMVVLAACGGGESASVSSTQGPAAGTLPNERSAPPTPPSPTVDQVPALATATATDGPVRKSGLVQAVHRLYNRGTGAHFYTRSTSERDNILATMPQFSYDGIAFQAAASFSPGLSPVYRFYNTRTGVHFYTIDEAERANIQATLPHFQLDGVAYHASQVAGQGLVPLHRFYVPARGFHFYTASEAERNTIQSTLSGTYRYEGIGYHVLASSWTALKLPHSGVSETQCYQAGSSTLVACGSSGPLALDNQQDGYRALYNPMAYETVNYFAGSFWFAYPLTSCVRDRVTGLVWEGKTASGDRSGSRTFTNLGGGAAGDVSSYVAAVNASNLCGFNDWRVPTLLEMTTLQQLGRATTPRIDTTWFPNTANNYHWTSDIYANNTSFAWMSIASVDEMANFLLRNQPYAVRLVRGSMAQPAPRYSFSTAAYGSDAANNLVIDGWTGLQWRRCLEGQVWSGSTCTGSPTYFTHEQALAHDGHISLDRWRMPNAKELDSIVDRSRATSPLINPTAFPGAPADGVWSTTPYVANPSTAYMVRFNLSGTANPATRSVLGAVRLIHLP